MKQLWLLLFILPVILWTSCETETLPSESPQSLAENILSRSNGIESLTEGSKILLNARGGVTIEDKIFTYTNGSWSNDNGYQWEKTNETTHIMALHPHDINNLYKENVLKDILIAHYTLSPEETDITLNFKHLFASFTLNVEESLIDDIAEIKLTSPKSIESISSSTGEITLSDISMTTTLSGNGNNSYAFIIPPMEASLSLGITLKGGTSKTYTLKNHLFKSGFKYECKLRGPGIVDANDLIAFCQLINNPNTYDGGRELEDFGITKDNKTTIYLLADINLTNTECAKLRPIGNDAHPFSYSFDGKGHTISNFIASPFDGYAGLFGIIDTTGKIQNLHLSNCSTLTISSGANKGAGIISGRCKGLISNCSVSTSSISTTQDTNTGGITGMLIGGGSIINCSVTNSEFTSTTGPVGAIAGKIENNGYIYNSYSAFNIIQNRPNSTNTRGGIVGSINNGIIQNCYVYNLTFDSRKDNRGQITGRAINSTINYYYYDQDLTRVNNISNCTTTPNYKYDNSVVIYTLLNQWITNNQSSYNYTFTTWAEDQTETLPAIFTP